MPSEPPLLTVHRLDHVGPPRDDEWTRAERLDLRSWDGAPDPLTEALGASHFGLLHDGAAVHLRAEVAFSELHVEPAHPVDRKVHGLWEHDVVELFLSRSAAPTPYGEVEGSPLGQWLDYLIEEPRVRVDRDWASGVTVSARLAERRFVVELTLPFAALGGSPARGEERRGNVYVAQGPPGARRYLAFAPTGTPQPDFHVPARFARLRFA